MNAGLALIDSMRPATELEALLAVQIVATGFPGLRFLRESQRHITNDCINVYGGYANKLLRLHVDLILTAADDGGSVRQRQHVINVFPPDRADQPFRIANGDCADVGRSRMPMARTRRTNTSP